MYQVYTIMFASMYVYYEGKRIIVVLSYYIRSDVYCSTLVRHHTLLVLSTLMNLLSVCHTCISILHHNTMLLILSYYCTHTYTVTFIIQIFTSLFS